MKDLVPAWRPSRDQVLWTFRIVIVLVLVLAVLTLIGLPFGITLWEWVKLLIVPAVIAAGGLWFNQQQQARAQESANQRVEDETLQAYITQISELLRDKERPLAEAEPGDTVSGVAHQLTRALLTRIDGRRKGQALQFLYESGLITSGRAVMNLWKVNLREAQIGALDLTHADLQQTQLDRADLRYADLKHANMRGADLNGANLRGANLEQADLRETILFGADLTDALISDIRQLNGARLGTAQAIDRATGRTTSLEDTTMPNGQKYEEWLESRREEGRASITRDSTEQPSENPN
jgi:uncharacterized protein YjbI with pentapeptide repeats